MIRAIIIDDEAKARDLLRKMLKEYCPDVDMIGDCEDLPNGVKAIRKLKPDLVFLDIEMPGHSGLELLDFFDEGEMSFSVIFVTAYNNYAIKAFKLSAVDYLLKPVEPADIEQAIERYKRRNTREKNSSFATLKENLRDGVLDKIAVPDSNSIKFLQLGDILYFKADKTYTDIFFVDGSKLTISRTLKNIEDTVGNVHFFRCHKSYIVNMKYVTDYVKSEGGYLVINGKHTIPLSPDRVHDLMSLSTFVKR
jgi:two-component system LytT family response regulator